MTKVNDERAGGFEVPRKKEMTLVAARKPQMKQKSKRDWSKAKAEKFLSVLADTCNVSEACRKSRVPMTVAYRRRKMDAGFRAEWREAIATAYQRLEALLLDRAFNGTEKVIKRRKRGADAGVSGPYRPAAAPDAPRDRRRSRCGDAAGGPGRASRADRQQAATDEETG